MAGTMTELVEYLLAYRKRDGGRLARFGTLVATIPAFPPGTTVVFNILPYFEAYANIEFYNVASPAIVPGAFQWSSIQAGMELVVGVAGRTVLAEGHNTWIEYTRAQPIITTVTNVSGLVQFFEAADFFLIVDTEDDLKEIRGIVARWGWTPALEEGVGRTNQLLEELLKRTPISGRPSPVPPPAPLVTPVGPVQMRRVTERE